MQLIPHSIKNRFERVKARFNSRSEQRNEKVVKKPETPRIQSYSVDYSVPELPKRLGPFNSREELSAAAMNRTRQHRNRMKKYNRRQKRMNPRHGVKS